MKQLFNDVVDDHSCDSHSEGCGDVAERTVDLCLSRAPFVFYQLLVARSIIYGSIGTPLSANEFGFRA